MGSYAADVMKDLVVTAPVEGSTLPSEVNDAIREVKRVLLKANAITSVTTNTTLTASHGFVLADTSSNAIEIDLPAVADVSSASVTKMYVVTKSNGGYDVTIKPNGSETLQGKTSFIISDIEGTLMVWGNGTGWFYSYLSASVNDPVGTVKHIIDTTAPDGWLFLDGKSIGNASSGATSLADAKTKNLFVKLWGSLNTITIQNSDGTTSTKGASAVVDFDANKRIVLPDARGRSILGAGAGSGLTSRGVGDIGGEENHQLSVAELAYHNHGSATGGESANHSHYFNGHVGIAAGAPDYPVTYGSDGTQVNYTTSGVSNDHVHGISPDGSNYGHNTLHPFLVICTIIKY